MLAGECSSNLVDQDAPILHESTTDYFIRSTYARTYMMQEDRLGWARVHRALLPMRVGSRPLSPGDPGLPRGRRALGGHPTELDVREQWGAATARSWKERRRICCRVPGETSQSLSGRSRRFLHCFQLWSPVDSRTNKAAAPNPPPLTRLPCKTRRLEAPYRLRE